MFKIASRPTFSVTVNLSPVSADSGTIDFDFKYIPPKSFDEFNAGCANRKTGDVLADIIVGWRGVQDQEGNEIPYSIDALKNLLSEFYLAETIFMAFADGLRGAREKN